MADFPMSSLQDVYDLPQLPKKEEPQKPQYIAQYVPQYVPQYIPVPIRPTRLNRIDTMLEEHNGSDGSDGSDGMLPSLWWIFTYMGLTALTAIGIRSSSK